MAPSDYIHMDIDAEKRLFTFHPCSASARYGLVNLYNYYC